jgi:hypothetical protein
MNKTKILKLKKDVFNAVSNNCRDSDSEIICEKISAILDEHFNLVEQKSSKSKPYLASTGSTEKQTFAIRTKGESQRADGVRGL